MAEDYADEYEWSEDTSIDNGISLSTDDGGEGDFQDGSLATGMGRGDPGRDEEFTKLQTENQRLAERAAMVDRFEQNPEAALRRIAGDMGMELVPRGQRDEPSSQKPSAEFLAKLGERLPEEWKFLGDVIGPALWDTTQSMVKPLEERQTQQQQASRKAEVDQIESRMDAEHPNWRGSLPQMQELYSWLVASGNNGGLQHPKYGSVYEAMYKLVSGDAVATRNAANRMRSAAQNATSVSDGQAGMGPSLDEQMKNAKTRQERMRLAFRNALSEHGVR